VEANSQLYLIRTTSREGADAAAWQAQLPGQRSRVLQALGDARWNQFMAALRENAEIVDNRREVLRQPAVTSR
jgi:hypothetical protein